MSIKNPIQLIGLVAAIITIFGGAIAIYQCARSIPTNHTDYRLVDASSRVELSENVAKNYSRVVADELIVSGSVNLPDGSILAANRLEFQDGGRLVHDQGGTVTILASFIGDGSIDVSGADGSGPGQDGRNGGHLRLFVANPTNVELMANGGDGATGANGERGANGRDGNCRAGAYRGAQPGRPGGNGQPGGDGGEAGKMTVLLPKGDTSWFPDLATKSGNGAAGGVGGAGGQGGDGCVGLGGSQPSRPNGPRGRDGANGVSPGTTRPVNQQQIKLPPENSVTEQNLEQFVQEKFRIGDEQ